MPSRDPLFAPWSTATIGRPVLVRAPDGGPAYWLVPVERDGRAIGFVRVTLDGDAVAAGAHYRRSDRTHDAPAYVTGIDSTAALALAQTAVAGTPLDEPMYVHDGPPGREAWLVRLRDRDGAVRTLFVTAGGTYERDPSGAPAGDLDA